MNIKYSRGTYSDDVSLVIIDKENTVKMDREAIERLKVVLQDSGEVDDLCVFPEEYKAVEIED